ncbi:MAG: AAA family ATPase [Rhodoluna sp.]
MRQNNKITSGSTTVYLKSELIKNPNYTWMPPGSWSQCNYSNIGNSISRGTNIIELCQTIWGSSEDQVIRSLCHHMGIDEKSDGLPFPKGEWYWDKQPLPHPFLNTLPIYLGSELRIYSGSTLEPTLIAVRTSSLAGYQYRYFSRWRRDAETGTDANWIEALPPDERPLYSLIAPLSGSNMTVRIVPSEFDQRLQNFGDNEIYCAVPGGATSLPKTNLTMLAGHKVHLELLHDQLADTPSIIDALERSKAKGTMISLIGEADAFPLDCLREVAARHGHSFPLPVLPEALMSDNALITAGIPLPPSANPRRQLLTPVIQEGGLVWLYAREKVGKTWLALSIAQAVSLGEKLGPWQAPEAASVLYIDGEMHPDDLQAAIGKVTRGQGNQATVSFDALCAKKTKRGVINLMDPDWQEEIKRRAKGVRLLILDNFYSLTNNNVGEFPEVLDFLQRLRAQGTAVLVVDHANREGVLQGAHTKERAAETIIELRVPEGRHWREKVRAIEVKKSRHDVPEAEEYFTGTMAFTPGTFRFEVDMLEALAAPEPLPKEIAKLAPIMIARDIDKLSFPQIQERLGTPRSTASDWYRKAKSLTGPDQEALDQEIRRLLDARKAAE